MFAVTVEVQVKSDQANDFLPLMLENARLSRRLEPACQLFDVCQDGACFFLYEVYDDQASFEAHLASDHFQRFDAATLDMVIKKTVKTYGLVLR